MTATSAIHIPTGTTRAEGWVDGIIPCFEVEEILNLTRRQIMDRVRRGTIPTCGAVGGDPEKPLFDLATIRGLAPGTQEELW